EYIVPTMEEDQVYVEEAMAVAKKAIEQGVAQKILSDQELREKIEERIKAGRIMERVLVNANIIKLP
ncbi:MAG TPA: malate dehydrogenase, partial [Pseudothermotoga sp.]